MLYLQALFHVSLSVLVQTTKNTGDRRWRRRRSAEVALRSLLEGTDPSRCQGTFLCLLFFLGSRRPVSPWATRATLEAARPLPKRKLHSVPW